MPSTDNDVADGQPSAKLHELTDTFRTEELRNAQSRDHPPAEQQISPKDYDSAGKQREHNHLQSIGKR